MTSNDNLNSEPGNRFSKIWDRDNLDSQIESVANRLGEHQEPPKETNLNKTRGTRDGLKLKWGFGSPLTTFIVFIITQVIYASVLVSLLGPEGVLEFATTPTGFLISTLSMYVVWIGGMFVTSKRKGTGNFFKDFNVSFKKRDFLYGLGLAIALFGLVQGITFLLTDVFHVDLTGADNTTSVLSYSGPWLYIIAFGFASFLGPICEELFFRGYLMGGLSNTIENRGTALETFETEETAPIRFKFNRFLQKIRVPFAVIISSVFFGFMHFQGTESFGQWFVVIVTGTLGMGLALMAIKTGRLGASIVAHILYNASTISIGVFFGG